LLADTAVVGASATYRAAVGKQQEISIHLDLHEIIELGPLEVDIKALH
jgi:hypothetical protein